jgi:hypothetical protein
MSSRSSETSETQIKGRLLLSKEEKATLAEIAHRLGRDKARRWEAVRFCLRTSWQQFSSIHSLPHYSAKIAALNLFDKLFWVAISRLWLQWKRALIVVSPETVVRWHRAGFRMYWRLISRVRGPVGRRPTQKEVRELIFQMVAENPTWGAPRIHGELLMLGLDISERTLKCRMRLRS